MPETVVEERTVAVVVEAGADALTTAATAETAIKNEFALYEPMRRMIAHDWAKDHRREPLAVEITALQGRRATGGIWSRPDIVSVEVRTSPTCPESTSKLPPSRSRRPTLSTSKPCTRRSRTAAPPLTPMLLQVPADQADNLGDNVADVAEAERAHGVGVVPAADPADYDTWEEREEAPRIEPDPERLNTFVAIQLSDTHRTRPHFSTPALTNTPTARV
ncbi:hypothetical protein [Micromonospora sp. NPDC049497]|uniref:hypothetical protein n=1 Tax=Micromonospora sp. NPDC049497 TaxID=3364273 RepID=UPI00379345AE